MAEKIYITTPIYYVNDVPHIGHAYTTIAADVLARYYKGQGREVFFLTGTDEHGAKIAEAAEKAGKNPKEFVDDLIPKFEEAWRGVGAEYNCFFRTTNAKHEKIVQDFILELQKAGFIEKRKYEGLYCVGCEKFLLPDDLIDGKCPDHNREPVKQTEENYFFLLSKFSDKLLNKIESGELNIQPESRKNEIVGKIKAGLEDVSISREAVVWGVKFPGDESQTVYVWVDALINYYSATKIYDELDDWEKHPADIHLMAKDILWFHAVIWPAMLLATNKPLPKKIYSHGFFTINGKKMSKSVGNVLNPNDLVKKFGSDAVRYALLREFPFGEDGDISEEKVANRYEKELANGIGNLLQRTLTMVNKYQIKPKTQEKDIFGIAVREKIEVLDFMEALTIIRRMTEVANEQIEEGKPWQLAKEEETEKLQELLNNIYWILFCIANNIQSFMPETAEKMKKQLETLKPEPLFPRIENV